jgi:hypothetical protein
MRTCVRRAGKANPTKAAARHHARSVLRLYERGLTQREIASRLGLTKSTVASTSEGSGSSLTSASRAATTGTGSSELTTPGCQSVNARGGSASISLAGTRPRRHSRRPRLPRLASGVPAPGVDERPVLEADQTGLDQAATVHPDGGDQRGPPLQYLLDVPRVNGLSVDPDVRHVSSSLVVIGRLQDERWAR